MWVEKGHKLCNYLGLREWRKRNGSNSISNKSISYLMLIIEKEGHKCTVNEPLLISA